MTNEVTKKGRKRKLRGDRDELDEEEKERRRQTFQDLREIAKARQSLVETDEDRIRKAKSHLHDHICAEERKADNEVLFFVEIGPHSSHNGVECHHPTCKDRIEEDSYRIAVRPGMNSFIKFFKNNPDFYHPRCFEDLADFSQAAYLNCIMPATRDTACMRGIQGMSMVGGNFLVDGGAERLVFEWKRLMSKLINKRDGKVNKPLDPDFDDLLHRSGSASYRPKNVDGITGHEYFILSKDLAPIETDGVDDQEEWNLFKEYLPLNFEDIGDLNNSNSLSDTLRGWAVDKFLACNDEGLNDKGRELKKEMNKKSIRAIKRLSSIPMSDFQCTITGRSRELQ